MNNVANSNAIQEQPASKVRKAWEKPALDILELERAQHGNSSVYDGAIKHHSG